MSKPIGCESIRTSRCIKGFRSLKHSTDPCRALVDRARTKAGEAKRLQAGVDAAWRKAQSRWFPLGNR